LIDLLFDMIDHSEALIYDMGFITCICILTFLFSAISPV
jgi:hypothetical protein